MPLILKEQDEMPCSLCSKSVLKIYFKCFMIRDIKSYLAHFLRISSTEAICKCCRVLEVEALAKKTNCILKSQVAGS